MTMKSCFSASFLLFFFCGTASGLGSVVYKHYSYIHRHHNWSDAQSYCRSSTYYNDLATIFKKSDEDKINLGTYHAWIGLYRVPSSTWWKWTDGYVDDNNDWAEHEPHPGGNCAFVSYSSKKFSGTECERFYFFYCRKSSGGGNRFKFIPQSKTWTEAQDYCKSKFVDLAAFSNRELRDDVHEQDFPVWTGLHREGGTWKWSSGFSEYRNWASNEPSNQGDCVSISSKDKKMSTQNCSHRFPVLSYWDNLVLVKENKTWEEALEHCRGLPSPTQHSLRYELLSVQPGEEQEYVVNTVKQADTEEVWAGLRFLAGEWLWVNGATMLYPDLPLCPPFSSTVEL